MQLPESFVWGASTSAYQIEGAVTEDGRGASVWDTFCHRLGTVNHGETGDVACDHYHRYAGDVQLAKGAGLDAYRFSISWPRVQPDGLGAINHAGLDFYDRLVDRLLEAGLQPWATLFHWDLPQPLQDQGGWLNRQTAEHFARYARVVGERLGDRLHTITTLNEPFIVMSYGYAIGTHAPGEQLGFGSFPVAHHQLLGHGLAMQELRAVTSRPLGIANSYAPAWPGGSEPRDRLATLAMDALHNHVFTGPLLVGEYPMIVLDLLRGLKPDALSVIRRGDLDLIREPIDFLGVNYYQPDWVTAAEQSPVQLQVTSPPGYPRTHLGWAVVPDGLTSILTDLSEHYRDCPPLVVTENGCAQDDRLLDGAVHDPERIEYLAAHIDAVLAAKAKGVDVRGYFVWSLLDNFEWAEGYEPRFGLVHVDFDSQQRTPKDSYFWLRDRLAAIA